MKLKKVVLSCALAFNLLIGSVLPAMAMEVSEDTIETTSESVPCLVKQGNGAYLHEEHSADEIVNLQDGELTKLPAPAFAKWSTEAPGVMTWGSVEEAGGYYYITVYKDGGLIWTLRTNGYNMGDEEGICRDDFAYNITESGTYTFTVYCEGDKQATCNSDKVTSDEFVYNVPEVRYAQVQNLRWDSENPMMARWSPVPGATKYCARLYRDGETRWSSHTFQEYTTFDWAMVEAGSYTFDVVAYGDITKAYRSEVSVMSAPTYCDDASGVVKDNLSKALSGSADDALKAVTSVSKGTLAAVMQKDKEALDLVKQIEDKYKTEKGINVSQNTDDTVNSLMDTSKIAVAGTAFNAANGTKNMSLNFAKESNPVNVNSVLYKNAVQFNISLDGATDSSNLQVPIHITIPIPKGMNAERFKVLHYHKDGSMEIVTPTIDEANNTASFTVTSFSTFVFANEEETEFTDPEFPFIDVPVIKDNWKYESVKFVNEHNLMGGVGGSPAFQPDRTLTRSMFATVLYRMAGNPQVTFVDKFTDVKAGIWYSDAIIWANQNGIVDGYLTGAYGIDDNITREQIAKMLYMYAKNTGQDVSGVADITTFTDTDTVSGWATDYIKWAVDAKMISGKPNGDGSYRIDPKGNATRAECAKMLKMFIEKYGLN